MATRASPQQLLNNRLNTSSIFVATTRSSAGATNQIASISTLFAA